MKLAIMQPYFFPYLGYFHLIAAVDMFVVYDDVQWSRGGWINRNRILVNGQPNYITLPLRKESSSLNINERHLALDMESWKNKLLRQIENAYHKAPYFESVFSLVTHCLADREQNLSAYLVNTLRTCCDYLGIDTPFVVSSQMDKTNTLRGVHRGIEICKKLGADHYINSIGGITLYNKEPFSANGIRLSFIKARNVSYPQFPGHEFVPFLSILDVMMFNSQQRLTELLSEYDLVEPLDSAPHV